jgi:hypothetical protein
MGGYTDAEGASTARRKHRWGKKDIGRERGVSTAGRGVGREGGGEEGGSEGKRRGRGGKRHERSGDDGRRKVERMGRWREQGITGAREERERCKDRTGRGKNAARGNYRAATLEG